MPLEHPKTRSFSFSTASRTSNLEEVEQQSPAVGPLWAVAGLPWDNRPKYVQPRRGCGSLPLIFTPSFPGAFPRLPRLMAWYE